MSKDLFSKQADTYAKYRPNYPDVLYDFINGYVTVKDSAWDCATGNGQAASALARHFRKVIATDISEKQIGLAEQRDNIEYMVCSAEETPFPGDSFDLITVAQAYHWFKFDEFKQEVTRVGKDGGVIAIWGYNLITSNDAAIDSIIDFLYSDTLGEFWDPERTYVEQNYSTVPFDFPLLASRDFRIDCEWTRNDLVGYLHSWSAVQHFISRNHQDPVDLIQDQLALHWNENESRKVSFPLFLKLGTIRK